MSFFFSSDLQRITLGMLLHWSLHSITTYSFILLAVRWQTLLLLKVRTQALCSRFPMAGASVHWEFPRYVLFSICPVIVPKCDRDTVIVQINCSGCKCTMLRMQQSYCVYTDHVLDGLCTDAHVPHCTGSCISLWGDPEELWETLFLRIYLYL